MILKVKSSYKCWLLNTAISSYYLWILWHLVVALVNYSSVTTGIKVVIRCVCLSNQTHKIDMVWVWCKRFAVLGELSLYSIIFMKYWCCTSKILHWEWICSAFSEDIQRLYSIQQSLHFETFQLHTSNTSQDYISVPVLLLVQFLQIKDDLSSQFMQTF